MVHAPSGLAYKGTSQHIANRLNAAAAQGAFDELVIVAPPHTMNGIRDHLNSTTAPTVAGTLAKDLVKTPDHELWPHLRPCIPLAPRTA
jgi:protein required for attachment to host cells